MRLQVNRTLRRLAIVSLLTSSLTCGGSQAKERPHREAVLDSATARALDEQIQTLKFIELEKRVSSLPPSVDRDYFAGVSANRGGQLAVSTRLLEQALPRLRSDERRRTALALATLADDYLKLFRYKDAETQYARLIRDYPQDIDPALLDNIKDDFGVIQLMVNFPPQTIERNGSTKIKTVRSQIGTLDGSLTIGGVESPWILDTGANFSVVTTTLAKRMHVTISENTAHTKGGVTGLENTIHVGLLPSLTLGSIIVHNVVLLVFDDDGLRITLGPKASYQIQGILGYPVFQSLGAVRFEASGYFSVDTASLDAPQSSRLFMNKLTPLIAGDMNDKQLLFAFDTGANTTQFTRRYYQEFPDQFTGLKLETVENGGAGGATKTQMYLLPQATIRLSGQPVVLHNVATLTGLMGTELDDSYGNLGRDVTAGYKSFTFDFVKMTFVLGDRIANPQ